MLRRNFLLGTAAALALRGQGSRGDFSDAGSLVYVQHGTVWIRRLPDGTPRALAAGNAVWEPRFSPSGRWISFRDGDELLRVVSADGERARSWLAVMGQWLPGRDELAVYSGESTVVFGSEDDWTSPRMRLEGLPGAISPDGRQRVWQSDSDAKRLLPGSLDGSEAKLIAETQEGGFEVMGFAREAGQDRCGLDHGR